MKRIVRTTLRTLRATLVTVSLLLLLALWVLRSEWAQNQLVPIMENALENALGVAVEVGSVDIDLPAYAVLNDLKMKDAQNQDMFVLKRVRIGFGSFSLIDFLLHPKDVHTVRVSDVQLIEPEAHLYRSRKDSVWNYACLSSDDPDTTPSKPFKLNLGFPVVELRGGTFSMVDSTLSDSALAPRKSVNFSNLLIRNINSDLSFNLEPDLRMSGNIKDFSVVEGHGGLSLNQLATAYVIELKPKAPSKLSIRMKDAHLRLGRTNLNMDADLEDIRPDTGQGGFHPVFKARFRPSEFDFLTLNKLLPKPLPMVEPLILQGSVYGDMSGIFSDSIDVGLMEKTRLRTAFAMTGYRDPEKLKFKFDIAAGSVSFEELQRFLPSTQVPLHGTVGMRGTLLGTLDQLQTQKLEVRYLDQTHLFVDARLTDYTKGDDIFMEIKFKNSKFRFDEIKRLLPDMALPPWLAQFGTCGINGKYIGGINDFVVNADMTSAFGNVSSNLHLILPNHGIPLTYDGWISTENINFVALNADLPVSSSYFNFNGKVKGSGSEWGKINADIDGTIHASDIGGYHIDSVYTKELILRGYNVTGEVDVLDKQGSASVKIVDINLDTTAQHYSLVGDVKDVDLAHYKILPNDSVLLTTVFKVDVGGKNVETDTGIVRFIQLDLVRPGSKDSLLSVKKASLTARLNDNGDHVIKFKSSLADMGLVGTFKYTQAISVMENLAQEAQLYIKNKDSVTADYYAHKVLDSLGLAFRDTIRTKGELNQAFDFFQVPLYLSPGTELRTRFEHTNLDGLEVIFRTDSMGYANVGMDNDSVFLTMVKDGSQNYFLGNGYISVKDLALGKNLHFLDVSFEPTADAAQVDYYLRAKQPAIGSSYLISAHTDFKGGGVINSRIRSAESKLVIRGKTWKFSEGNSIVHLYERPPSFTGHGDSVISRYYLEGIKLQCEGQEITVGGIVSKDSTDTMTVKIRNLSIKNVMQVMDSPADVDGTLAWADFVVGNVLGGLPNISCDGEVVNFRFSQVDSIGMRFHSDWPSALGTDYAMLHLEVGNWGRDSVIADGWYNVANDSLHFDAEPSTLQLEWIEPFVQGILSDMHGRVALDHFKVRGTSAAPYLDGTARFTNTSFKVDYFNNVFAIGDNQITFDHERAKLPRIILHDTQGGSAELNGTVYYHDTSGVKLDLHLNHVNNFLFMDTRKANNDVFYGHLVLDGDSARVTGFLTAPNIEAWVKTGDGSWLDIPISGYTSANRLDYVNFIQKGDTTYKAKKADYGGMKMLLHVNAKRNAKVRLIFDEFAGDIIEARGDGNLIVQLTEDGEFKMYNEYIVHQGDYHFTMENVVNKKFTVKEGGSITWNGDPFDAIINLDAVYDVNADMSAILGPGSSGNRVPVQIIMHMQGSLMAPEITLSLQLQMNEQDVFGLGTFFAGIQYDQQELNKQVVSLLMFRRFAATSSSGGGGGSTANVTSSLSELVSNQVNHWLSQSFADPKVGVEVTAEDFSTVQLALKASLFNDRVTVERNGVIAGKTTTGNITIGDVIVLIKVLPKQDTTGRLDPNAGQLVMEIFNREDASITNANNVTRGTGMFYKKDFDRLRDIFQAKKERRKRGDTLVIYVETPEKEETPVIEGDTVGKKDTLLDKGKKPSGKTEEPPVLKEEPPVMKEETPGIKEEGFR